MSKHNTREYEISHKIEGSTIRYHMHSTDTAGPFSREHFDIRLAMDLCEASLSAIYSGFLALFLSAFDAQSNVVVRLPKGVHPMIPWTWTRFHQLPGLRVYIGGSEVDLEGMDNSALIDDYNHCGDAALENGNLVVLFGGGKDSSLSLDLFARHLGTDRVTALTLMHFRAQNSRRERRHMRLSILPVTNTLQVGYRTGRTSFWSALRDRATFRPGMALYYAAALFEAELSGTRAMCYSLEYTHYYTRLLTEPAIPTFHFRNTRPEFNRLVSIGLSTALGEPFVIFNAARPLTERHPISYLRRTSSKILPHLLMCENTTNSSMRFCHRCKKCFEYSLHSMINECAAENFDFDGFYADSDFIKKALSTISNDSEFFWSNHFGVPFHCASTRSIINSLGPVPPNRLQRPQAKSSWAKIYAALGGSDYPFTMSLWRDGINEEDFPSRNAIWSDMARFFDSISGTIAPVPVGNVPVAIEPNKAFNIFESFKKKDPDV